MCWTQPYTRHRQRQTRQITQYYMCWTQPYTRHRRRQARQITLHYMCWTQPYTRHRTTKSQTNNTTLYVLDTTIHKTLDADKQDKLYNTIYVGHNLTQDTGQRQTRQITQHYMCWTQPYTRLWTTTNKTNNTTLYVLDTAIHKTQTTTNKTNNTTLYVLNTTIHKTLDDDKQEK
jgi:hypothetical protein